MEGVGHRRVALEDSGATTPVTERRFRDAQRVETDGRSLRRGSSGAPTARTRCARRHADAVASGEFCCNAYMIDDIVHSLTAAFASARKADWPYPRWYPTDLLPSRVAQAVCDLPFEPPDIGDTLGRRETHNATRRFFAQAEREKYTVCDAIASAYEHPEVVRTIEATFGCSLSGTFLRIEHCLDTGGFWLAPHTDLGVKRFTLLHYLSDHPDAEAWGTDVYANADEWVERAPAAFNSALVFVPSDRTWHGFERREIAGVRRSLIVNYVTNEWRNRHELARDVPVA